jgi:hypothetical protein
MLGSRGWSKFNGICRNAHALIFENFYKFFKINKHMGILRIFTRFNSKSNGESLNETFGNFNTLV